MSLVPKVSILIPTYNYAHCLDEAMESVLSQTFSDYEVIVIDDGSTDNTDEVMQKYASDPRVAYYKNPVNLGLVGNWNKCLSYATGKYIKFLCADDKFRSDLLEKFVAVMEECVRSPWQKNPYQIFERSRRLVYPIHPEHPHYCRIREL